MSGKLSFIRFYKITISISTRVSICVTTLIGQPDRQNQRKSVRSDSPKETAVRLTDGKLSICHHSAPFRLNSKGDEGIQRTDRAVSEFRLAVQIRAKGVILLFFCPPRFVLGLKGVRERRE